VPSIDLGMRMDWDTPEAEEQWCQERRAEVAGYLAREEVPHGRIGDWPAWFLVPYVSLWAIESSEHPGEVGWWAICGDLPCDYLSAEAATHPREAVRAIAERWQLAAGHMESGLPLPGFSVGSPEEWPTLAPLLASRAGLLLQIVADDEAWQDP
jgi:hypothetical protein